MLVKLELRQTSIAMKRPCEVIDCRDVKTDAETKGLLIIEINTLDVKLIFKAKQLKESKI